MVDIMPEVKKQCSPTSRSTCKGCGGSQCLMEKPLAEILQGKEFDKQLHKWGHHQHLPHWAEDQLVNRVKMEIDRRKQMQKFTIKIDNVIRPWRWAGIYHTTHPRDSDVPFPVHAPHHHGDTFDKSMDEVTQLNEEEAFMTDDLVQEIMEDDEPDILSDIIEQAGAKSIDQWSQISVLNARNRLFIRSSVHQNTVRSMALVNPKHGDPRPGKVKLETQCSHSYNSTIICTKYDKYLAHNHGILDTKIVDMEDNSH